jgi:hypothetical protein
MKRLLLITAPLWSLLCLMACAEDAELKDQFATPPSEFRVALDGPKAQEYADEGISGTLLKQGRFPSPQAKGNIDPAWMQNPKFFKKLSADIAAAKQKGQQVWYYDELGFPSTSAAGQVVAGHPEYIAQILRCRSFESAGKELEISPEGTVIHCAAFPLKDDVIDLEGEIDLTAKAVAGTFSWKPAKSGNWRVCIFEQVASEAWKRHDQTRPISNIMDKDAMARFIELTHERLEEELGDQVQDIFLFFTDEPQLNCTEPWGKHGRQGVPPAVQWTGELPGAFETKSGYVLTDALPALFNNAGPMTGRYRHDFYDVYSDLISENYWGQIQDWCHKNGTRSSGHMLLEETLLYSVMFNGSVFKNWSRADLPGVDLLLLPRYDTMPKASAKEGLAVKMAASIREFGNKPGVFSESFGVCHKFPPKDTTYLSAAKGVAAWQYYQGLTHMITFSLQEVLTKEEYTDFANYTARLAVLCRRGTPVSDVAVLVPESSVWAFYNPPDGGPMDRYWECNPDVKIIDTVFNETCFALSSSQRDFEIMTEKLLQESTVKDARLLLVNQRSNLQLFERNAFGFGNHEFHPDELNHHHKAEEAEDNCGRKRFDHFFWRLNVTFSSLGESIIMQSTEL